MLFPIILSATLFASFLAEAAFSTESVLIVDEFKISAVQKFICCRKSSRHRINLFPGLLFIIISIIQKQARKKHGNG